MPKDRSQEKREWYLKNREKILKRAKEYNESLTPSRKEEKRMYIKEYHETHKEEAKVKRKEYVKNNRQAILTNQNENFRIRRKSDPLFKLRRNVSTMVWQALTMNKNGSILKYLSYTMEELKQHLENQFDEKMTWSNYGSYWHIDHIIPQSALPYASMSDDNFQKCWGLSNLRPLEAIENIRKSNK